MNSTTSLSSSPAPSSSTTIPQAIWDLQVPLYITHASVPNTPFVTLVPRFSYLAFLLPRLSTFFGLPCSSFHHEDILLRNLAVGLLADLYQPTLPWRLVVSDGLSWDIGDTFLNSAKEASYSLPPLPLQPYHCHKPTLISASGVFLFFSFPAYTLVRKGHI